MDDDDEFYDTVSVNSQLVSNGRRRNGSRDYLHLSRNTVYHSAIDLDMEMETLTPLTDNQHHQQRNTKNWRRFSKENDKTVDFVLAYDHNCSENAKLKRFEESLRNVGLDLETEVVQNIHFLKIHVPLDVLYQYAEILKLRMPLKMEAYDCSQGKSNIFSRTVDGILHECNVKLDPRLFPPRKYTLTADFSRHKLYLFDQNSPEYFNSTTRITVISYILDREKFGHSEHDTGIKKLLGEGVYKAAYPLHDGSIHEDCMRSRLLSEWASVSKWIKYQPIDEIKDYFGVKIALYFAWLGFYTNMLIPAAIMGLLSLFYGLVTLNWDKLSHDICTFNITMCPLCDRYCPYWELKDACVYSKISYLVDNPFTIVFAIVMSIWSALYLEAWKRYSADIAHRWGLTEFSLQAEPPRPEYLAKLANAKKQKVNMITFLSEPVVPFWRVKLPSYIVSFLVVFTWMILAVMVVFGIVIYRMSLLTSDALYADKSGLGIYVVPCTAGVINLGCIIVLNNIYNHLAVVLTDFELPRTQTEYEESLTLKIYLFQVVNYYSSLFYIAFLKGKFVGYPLKYNRIFGFRQEECAPGGCLMELTIQLAIIMIGNQFVNAILETILPLFKKMYNKLAFKRNNKGLPEVCTQNQWTEDYKLSPWESFSLFYEYLEMVLQYGFVTIFVTAFPLAPLFALINNIFEMRLDAKKMIKYFRRAVPKRVKDIGVWSHIMSIICRISIVSNALIIAFSSQFIPKLVYSIKYSRFNHTDEGFLQYSLAYFATADFKNITAPIENPGNVTICRYAEYRNPPDHEFPYKRPVDYWHIMAARLAFVVVYQNVVGFIITFLQWVIPDVPTKLRDCIMRENYQINECIIKQEQKMKDQNDRTKLSYAEETTGDINVEDQNGGLHQRFIRQEGEASST